MDERRGYPRLQMYAGVFLCRGETGYLSEVVNVSAGGASVTRPGNWTQDPGGSYHLYFVLDQERVLCIRGRVVHEEGDKIGFRYEPGYALQAEQLLAESRNWR